MGSLFSRMWGAAAANLKGVGGGNGGNGGSGQSQSYPSEAEAETPLRGEGIPLLEV